MICSRAGARCAPTPAEQPVNATTVRSVVLATCLEWPEISRSDALYAAALRERGAAVVGAPWNGPFTPFAAADLVVLRSTWDYHADPDGFRGWLQALQQAGRRVCNPPELVRWNLEKGYLLDLERRGVAIPQTAIAEDNPEALARAFDRLGLAEAVVKPAIGASGHRVRRLRRDEIARAWDGRAGTAARLLVQEFVPEVQSGGELSCIFFAGSFSHAVLKQPAPGEYRVNSQYRGQVAPTRPEPAVTRQAEAILTGLPQRPLYARVDGVVRNGTFLLMELELIEPSLYLQHAPPEAAARFAAATLRG